MELERWSTQELEEWILSLQQRWEQIGAHSWEQDHLRFIAIEITEELNKRMTGA